MSYRIPLFQLNYDSQEEEAVVKTLQSKWISTGPKCQELEETFAGMLGAKHALSVSNCTSALHLALKALGITSGDEVIVPSLTFVATVNAVKYVNAQPVFADIGSHSDLNISPLEIEKKITDKTKAIIVMHFAGFSCDMEPILKLAEKHNLKIIEDACHGPLSEYQGKKLGTLGDIGCFSFFSNKNLSTGEGGVMITNNTTYYDKIKLLRSHGMTSLSYERSKGHSTSYDVSDFGYNYRMDDIRASIGVVQLHKLEKDLNQRKIVRDNYVSNLRNVKGVVIPFAEHPFFSSNYIMPVVLENSNVEYRDEIRNKLHELGIQTSVHYPAAHRFTIYKNDSNTLPNTEYVTDNEITLPMYANLSKEDVDYITESLNNVLHE